MTKPARVVIPIDSQDPEAWKFAAAYAIKIGKEAEPGAQEYILLTHTKQQLKSTSLASHLGAHASKALLANQSLTLPDGGMLRHATLQTLRGSGRRAVIIAYFAEDGMLDTLDGLDLVTGIVAVPDFPGHVDNWIARWNPVVHGKPQVSAPAPLVADPVVANALESLSSAINLATGLSHPRDKSVADETLRILRAKGHALAPAKIKSWAIRHGWKPDGADELARLAERIGALKAKPSLTNFHDPEGRYERWSK
ncbi:hypothetical protein ACC699_07325 [Rhizobium ruizarguesonis]